LIVVPLKGSIKKAEALPSEKFDVDTEKYGLSFMVAFGYRKADPANPNKMKGAMKNAQDTDNFLCYGR
jgi:hypothetical protein